MAIVPTSSQQSIAAADVWSANLDDPAALADQAIQEGVSTEWDFGEFGKQAANALVDVTSYLPDFVGTLIGWMDQDYDESDWESTGERMFHNAGQGMRDWADKAFPADYEPVSFDQALSSWNKGNPGDMLRFIRDSSPQAMVYMGAAMTLGGVPLAISETQRILDDRMKRQELTVDDAGVADFFYSLGGAAVNVFLERLPIVGAMRIPKTGKFAPNISKSKFLLGFGAKELGTEFGQGTIEEVVTTADTKAGVDWTEAFKQGLAEMIGGMGVIAGTSPIAAVGRARNVRIRQAVDSARDEALENIDSELEVAKGAIDADEALTDLQKTRQKDNLDKEARKKRKSLDKAKSILAINALHPIKVDEEAGEAVADEELEAAAIDEATSVPATATEAASEIDTIDAEINKINEQVNERRKAKGRRKRGYTEQEANEVAALEARKREAQTVIDREAAAPAVTTREDAVARIAEIDAEIDSLNKEQVYMEGPAEAARKAKVNDLKARKVELQKTLSGLPTTPPREAETTPTIPPVAAETPPVTTETRPGELQITFATDLQLQAMEVSVLTADQQGTYFNLRDQGANHGQAMQGVLEGITEWKAPVTPVVKPRVGEAAPTDPAQLDTRTRALDRQRAVDNRAQSIRWEEAKRLREERINAQRAEEAAADLEAERLLDEKAQAETARQRIKAKESLITTPGLDPSTLTNEDVTIPGVSDADIRQAQIIKWNNNKRRRNSSRAAEAERIKNEEEVARQEEALNQRRENARKEAENAAKIEAATRKENIDADKEARKEANEREEATRKEENIATIQKAQNDARSLVDSFRENDANPAAKSPTLTQMRREKAKGLAAISRFDVDAREEFGEIVESGIQEIETSKREAKKDAEEAKPTEATREEGGKEPTPAGLTLNEFQAEYERIRTEQGEDAATQYFKDEAQNVAVEETTGGRPAVEPEVEKKDEGLSSPEARDIKKRLDAVKDEIGGRDQDSVEVQRLMLERATLEMQLIEIAATAEGRTYNVEEHPEWRSWKRKTEQIPKNIAKLEEEAKAAESETKVEEKVEEDVEVEEEQTADEQTQEMIDKEQATVAREVEEQAEVAREEQAAEDTGPVVEPEVAEVATTVKETAEVATKPKESVVDEETKEKEEVVKWRKRTTKDGTTSWRGSVGGLTARVTADPSDGMFNAIYDDAPVEGEKFATAREAQDFLVDNYAYPGQKRAAKARPSVTKPEKVKVEDQKKGNNPYAEEKENEDLAPVQVVNQPEEGTKNDWLVLVNGEPFKRYKNVVLAVEAAHKIPYEKYEETLKIQADRLEDKKKAVVENQKTDDTLYHVTRSEDVESITGSGILQFGGPRKSSNWVGASGDRLGDGEIYSFDSKDDAIRWASHMDWELNKELGSGKISIVSHKRGSDWYEDDRSGIIDRTGTWLAKEGAVPAEDIIDSEVFTLSAREEQVEAEAIADEDIDLEVSEEVLETIGKRAPRKVEVDEDTDEDIDLGWGDEQVELDKAYEKERRELKKQKKVDKVDPTFLMNEDNPTDLSARLTETESRGGYSASQIKTLAANIKKIDPNFEYNPKGKRGDVIASILEWYVSPSLESYEAQSEDNLGEFEGLTNDDVVESRRRDSTPEFLPSEQASASINRAFEGVFGRKAARRMRETGFVNIITGSEAREMGASKTAQAFISRANGSIYFIGDRMATNMDDSAMRGLIFHEMGVHLGRDIFSGTEWKQVLNELYLLGKDNDPTVRAAVARVMKAYDYKRIDAGRPEADGVNFEGRSKFWEEVLAHVVEMKQPGDIIVNKSLSTKIRSAFKKFFQKLANSFLPNAEQPSVNLDDLVNLVGYATTQAGVVGLARHGDSKTMERFRDRKRSEFIKDSDIKHPLYHGTYREWSHPLISKTELGLHVGTSLAAIERLGGRSADFVTPGTVSTFDPSEEAAIIVDAFTPGWESKISNKNLDNYYIRWREDSSDEGYYTRFRHGNLANIREGYVNIKNPLYVTRDLGSWSSPQAWFQYANSVEAEAEMTKWESLMGNTSYDVPLGEEGIALDMTPKSDVMVEISELGRKYSSLMSKEGPIKSYNRAAIGTKLKAYEVEFNGKLRELLKSKGYDSIEYVNASEDTGSKSYILLDDNMFKSVDDLAFDGTSIFSTRKAINQTNASEIVESRSMEEAAAKETILSRLGGARVNSLGNWIQRAVEPLMTIPGYDLLETKRMLAKGSVGDWHNKGSIIFDILNEATSKEKKAIFKYFTTRGADASKLPNRKVEYAEHVSIVRGRRPGDRTYTKTASIREKVVEVKKSIEKMGQDLVDEGFISEEQYAEWKNKYLPRVYIEHVMTGADKSGFGLSMSPLTYTKTRKEHESFMKDLVSGRIDDPAFLASRYMSMAGADMAIKKYMDYIASDPGNHGWVLPKQIMNFKGMNGTADHFQALAAEMDYRASILEDAKGKFVKPKSFADPEKAKKMRALASEMRSQAESTSAGLRGVDTSKYVKVPNTARFGSMRGLYVMKDIWTDINGLGLAGNPTWGKWLQWSGRAQKVFKYTKVPMNIPTQVRNIVSNTVLMNVSGTNMLKIPFVVSKAVHDVATNGKYMQIARKYGLESTTFASEELIKIDRELSKIKSKEGSFEGMWARTKVLFNDYGDVGGRAYQKTEVLFKVAKIIDLMENHGNTEAEAAKLANEALLDYSNVSQGIRLLRTMPLGSPFVTFNLKAAAQMVRNFKQHPLAVGKYAALPFLMAEMFLSQNDDLDDDDWDSLMEFLPDYMEKSMSTMVFPYKNDQNKWEAVDISFFLPWGAHLSLAKNVFKGEFGEAVKDTGMFAGPWEISGALKLNEDPFTGQPIYNEFDPTMQRYEDMLGFLASYMVPPMVWPRNRAGDIVKGGGPLVKTMMAFDFLEGNIGKDGLPRYTVPNALLSWLGVSVVQLSEQDVYDKATFKQKDLNKINRRYQQMIMDPSLSGNSKQAIADRAQLRYEYNKYWMKKYGEAIEWAEHLKDVDKLFK